MRRRPLGARKWHLVGSRLVKPTQKKKNDDDDDDDDDVDDDGKMK